MGRGSNVLGLLTARFCPILPSHSELSTAHLRRLVDCCGAQLSVRVTPRQARRLDSIAYRTIEVFAVESAIATVCFLTGPQMLPNPFGRVR